MARTTDFLSVNSGSNPDGVTIMLKFSDLAFKPHPSFPGATQAIMSFDNGYGISVIHGNSSFHCDDKTYEVAILKDGSLCYDTPLTDDVLGYQTKCNITKIMKELQTYEKDSKISSTV